MVAIIEEKQLLTIAEELDLVTAMRHGFIEYSNGNAVVPPVGELLFDNPKGEAHIKSGYLKGADYYTIKIASGFYDNPQLGISSSQGVVLLFSKKTGQLAAILLDNGKLTDLRTAAAGALVAKYFAPQALKGIGIIGTGIQAGLQLQLLLNQTDCNNIWIWGRNPGSAQQFKKAFKGEVTINIAENPTEVAANTNLIVTTTPSQQPLLHAEDILPGTHITAVGSDTETKQELAADLLSSADLVISDSLAQAESRGEVFQACRAGKLRLDLVTELGFALQHPNKQRTDDQQITIADLTGVAVQDIMIAEAIYNKHQNRS